MFLHQPLTCPHPGFPWEQWRRQDVSSNGRWTRDDRVRERISGYVSSREGSRPGLASHIAYSASLAMQCTLSSLCFASSSQCFFYLRRERKKKDKTSGPRPHRTDGYRKLIPRRRRILNAKAVPGTWCIMLNLLGSAVVSRDAAKERAAASTDHREICSSAGPNM